jgi:hypothetical protein
MSRNREGVAGRSPRESHLTPLAASLQMLFAVSALLPDQKRMPVVSRKLMLCMLPSMGGAMFVQS